MKSNYDILGNHIRLIDTRNRESITDRVLGINIDKFFMPSVANVIGTDLSKYKLITKGKFACNPMHVGRDERLPVALYDEEEPAIVSPAYFMFEVIDNSILNEDYLMMWFRRPEFDRICWLHTDGSVRGGITWDDICRLELPIPPIEKQLEIVNSYKAITERIALKKKINDNLVATLQIIYKKMFLESQNTYITKPLADLCSKIGSGATPKGGKAAYFDKGISLIRSMNVFDYFFSYPELAHISQIQANALANVEIQQADVLFNITGVSVTRCCVVPDDVLPARVNQHVMIIRPYKGKNMSYYIMCTLCTSENKAKLLGIGQSGSTREAINKQELERFEIPVPSDEELERFGEIATKIYALIFSNTNEIRMLCDMKDTLLTKLSSY